MRVVDVGRMQIYAVRNMRRLAHGANVHTRNVLSRAYAYHSGSVHTMHTTDKKCNDVGRKFVGFVIGESAMADLIIANNSTD